MREREGKEGETKAWLGMDTYTVLGNSDFSMKAMMSHGNF